MAVVMQDAGSVIRGRKCRPSTLHDFHFYTYRWKCEDCGSTSSCTFPSERDATKYLLIHQTDYCQKKAP
jgi:hypothetical protein